MTLQRPISKSSKAIMDHEIIQRKDAKAACLSTYYTGELCKHGHLALRYTTSGACTTCMGVSQAKERGTENVLRAGLNEAKRKFATESMAAKLRVHMPDLMSMRAAVGQLNAARWPLVPADILTHHKDGRGQCAGTALFEFRVHPDDYDLALQVAQGLTRLRGPTAEQMQRMNQWGVTKAAELDVAPPITTR